MRANLSPRSDQNSAASNRTSLRHPASILTRGDIFLYNNSRLRGHGARMLTAIDSSTLEHVPNPGLQLPSADDVAFFRDHGWWVSAPILPEGLLQAAENGFLRYRAGER